MFDSSREPQYAIKGLTEAQIDALPLSLYSNDCGAERYPECCVCLSALNTDENVFTAQCGHVYHRVSA